MGGWPVEPRRRGGGGRARGDEVGAAASVCGRRRLEGPHPPLVHMKKKKLAQTPPSTKGKNREEIVWVGGAVYVYVGQDLLSRF